jgi:hypothetical protein
MEEYYMIKIWQVIGLKENQNLTVKEQQDKITNILSDMKKDAETSAKRALKKEFIKTVSISLNAL